MNPLDEIEIRGIDEAEGVRVLRASDGSELFRYAVGADGAEGTRLINAVIDSYRAGYAQGREESSRAPVSVGYVVKGGQVDSAAVARQIARENLESVLRALRSLGLEAIEAGAELEHELIRGELDVTRPGEKFSRWKVDPARLLFVLAAGAWKAEQSKLLSGERKCGVCGCSEEDCSACVEATGSPCYWIRPDLCSRCHGEELDKAALRSATAAASHIATFEKFQVGAAGVEVEKAEGDPGDDDPLGIRAKEIAGQAIGFLNALRDPEVALKRLGAWMKQRYPERVATSYWITLGGERDKGFSLSIVRLPKRIDLAALLGTKTFGLEVKRDIFQIGDPRFGKYHGARVSLGLAAVTDYADHEEWTAALTLGIRF